MKSKKILIFLFIFQASSIFSYSIQDLIDIGRLPAITQDGVLNLSNLAIDSTNGLNNINNKQKIKFLSLRNNIIQSINAGDFASFTNLRRLDLGENLIGEIPDQAFDYNIKLSTLILDNNYILKIEADSFCGLVNLTHLDLSSNNIKEINIFAFLICAKLELLFLNNNKLANLFPYIFYHLGGLQLLDLEGNPLHEAILSTIKDNFTRKGIQASIIYPKPKVSTLPQAILRVDAR